MEKALEINIDRVSRNMERMMNLSLSSEIVDFMWIHLFNSLSYEAFVSDVSEMKAYLKGTVFGFQLFGES